MTLEFHIPTWNMQTLCVVNGILHCMSVLLSITLKFRLTPQKYHTYIVSTKIDSVEISKSEMSIDKYLLKMDEWCVHA